MHIYTINIHTAKQRFYAPWLSLLALVFYFGFSLPVQAEVKAKEKIMRPMVVYKSPTCGCCGAWVEHVERAGFTTRIKHPADLNAIKEQLGVAPLYQACHTVAHEGYVFEGHVPADVIQHFLAEAPEAKGLAVPGMPIGSPGMDAQGYYRPYEVLRLNKDGSSTPYARVSAQGTVYLGGR